MPRIMSDRGSATIWVTVMSLIVVMCATGGLVLGQTYIANRKAQGAADLGALAGASHMGTGQACVIAEDVVTRNGVRLDECNEAGNEITLVASLPNPLARWFPTPPIHSRARAGYASP